MARKKTTKKGLTFKFIAIVLSIVGVYALVACVGVSLYVKDFMEKKAEAARLRQEIESVEVVEESEEMKIFGSLPNKTIFACYGVDKSEALADVIMVCCFDKNSKQLSSISVPRDTGVVIPKERRDELREKGIYVPNYEIKINSVHSYAEEYGNEYLTYQLEDMLDVDISYYFQINVDAFIDLVDIIGGVEIDVPQRLYYSDPTQDLLINLYPGLQLLDGEQAQGFVRYRQYTLGDIDRIEMQKLFLKSIMAQAFSKDNIADHGAEFVETFLEHVDTDIRLSEALKYVQFIPDLAVADIKMETLPGIVSTPYIWDEEQAAEMVNRLFFDIVEETTTEATTSELTETTTEEEY